MKKILLVVVIIIFITLLLPLAIVWLIGGSGEGQSPIESGTVSVYVSEEDCVKDMDINEYLKCVVAAEVPADFEEEALKAQAVAARTYLYSHIAEKDKGNIAESHNGAVICTDSTHCQAYISEDKRRESWGAGADDNWNKISTAVDETTGQIMTYNDEIISAVFHSTSSGITESAVDVWGADVPYLQSVASTGDKESPKYHSELTLSEQEFKNIAEEKIDGVDWNIFFSSDRLINRVVPCLPIKSHLSFGPMIPTAIIIPDKKCVCTIRHLFWICPNDIFYTSTLRTDVINI